MRKRILLPMLACAAALLAASCDRGGTERSGERLIAFQPTSTPETQTTAFQDVPSTPVPTLAVPPTPGPDGDRPVARVGGAFVPLSEVLRHTSEREMQLQARPGESTESTRVELRRKVLDRLIEDRLVEWEADLGGVRLSPEEQEAGLARMIDGLGGYQRFVNLAQATGRTEEEMRAKLVRRLKVDRLFRRNVLDRMDLSEDTMRRYYETHRTEKFRVPACVYLRRVLVAANDDRPREAAQARAEELRNQAQAQLDVIDASYAALLESATPSQVPELLRRKHRERLWIVRDMALAHSDGPARQQGGNIALYDILLDGKREMKFDLAFVEHVYQHGQPDVLSPVIEAESGFLFYLVDRRLPAQQKDFEESRELIRNILRQEQRTELYAEWIQRLNARAGVEVYPEHLAYVDEEMIRGAAASRAEVERSLDALPRALDADGPD